MPAGIRVRPLGPFPNGSDSHLFILDNGTMRVSVVDRGAALASVELPTGGGGWVDVVLGPPSAGGPDATACFGATVGRVANRIAGATFELDGKAYTLDANDGPNHLHGGMSGFHRRTWAAEAGMNAGSPSVRLVLTSPDGDGGYPGRLEVATVYTLAADCSIHIDFEASTDAPTPVSLTNHAYWNLAGSGDILDHELELRASRYLPVDEGHIPTGEQRTAAGGSFDFMAPKRIGRDIALVPGGYDHCFALDGHRTGECTLAARVTDPVSGRALSVLTTLPGVQLYTGNFLAGVRGKGGAAYGSHAGLCLEPEFYPDTPNRPGFPSCALRPGERYAHRITYALEF